MDYKIRFAKSDDLDEVRIFDPHSKYIPKERIKSKIEQNEVIVAKESERIIGIIKFSYFWATRPYLDLIWITEDKRNQGLGSLMLAFLEKHLISNGYLIIHSSYEEGETNSLKWHTKNWFQVCGENSALNIPHKNVKEIFLYKMLKENVKKNYLKKYPI